MITAQQAKVMTEQTIRQRKFNTIYEEIKSATQWEKFHVDFEEEWIDESIKSFLEFTGFKVEKDEDNWIVSWDEAE